MVRVINRVLRVLILSISALLLFVGVLSDAFATSKLEAALNEYQSKVGPMETDDTRTDSEFNEYYQVYEALDGYYGDVEAINSDKRSFLFAKASEITNKSYESVKEASSNPFIANSEGSFNLSEDSNGDPLYDFSFLTVVPFKQSVDLRHNWFSQLSIMSLDRWDDRRIGANGGIGYRNYNADLNLILGVNSFYDHEFDSNHNRIGFGGEIKQGLLDLGVNYYHALSGKKTIKIDSTNGDERALSGFDAEAGHPFPFLPWTKAFFSYYFFDGEKGEDQKGFRYSSELYLSDHVTAEVGYNDDRQSDGMDQNYWFVKLLMTASPNINPTLFGTNAQPVSSTLFGYRDVKTTLEDKVRRRNKITVERIQTGSFQVGGN